MSAMGKGEGGKERARNKGRRMNLMPKAQPARLQPQRLIRIYNNVYLTIIERKGEGGKGARARRGR